jgi:hypothetical protein
MNFSNSGGDVLLGTLVSAGNLSVNNTGALKIGGQISAVSINTRSTAGVTLDASSSLTASGSGDAIVLNTGTGNFTNNAGASVFTASNGRWLVYSNSPLLDTRGGLAYNFKQYNTAFGGTILGSGNGFIYTLAPTVSFGLTGAISKPYDGTIAASLIAANFSPAVGAIDGDTINIPSSATGQYNSQNVNATSVTASGTASGTNGLATVYGYQYTASGAGTITPLSFTAQMLFELVSTLRIDPESRDKNRGAQGGSQHASRDAAAIETPVLACRQ